MVVNLKHVIKKVQPYMMNFTYRCTLFFLDGSMGTFNLVWLVVCAQVFSAMTCKTVFYWYVPGLVSF